MNVHKDTKKKKGIKKKNLTGYMLGSSALFVVACVIVPTILSKECGWKLNI